MKVGVEFGPVSSSDGGGVLSLFGVPSAEDEAYCLVRKGKKVTVGRGGCNFTVLPGWKLENTHPDVIALTALLAYGPFTKKEFTLDAPVSQHFAEAVKLHRGLEIGPICPNLKPRTMPKGARDALAFSGGVDSVAALTLLPKDTIPVFLHRLGGVRNTRSLYKSDAALFTCEQVKKSGYDVKIMGTSIERVRDPVGFPADWSNAAPVILHADTLKLRSVSFGMIAESAYLLGHTVYGDLAPRFVYKGWAPLFEAVNVPISLPTAGLSEVNTSRLAIEFGADWQPQSCIRGMVGQPCMNCFKCFRKSLLETRLTGKRLPLEHFDMPIRRPDVGTKLLDSPIHHEDVLAYSLHGIEHYPNELFLALKQKTSPIARYLNGLDLLKRHYTPAYGYLPEFLRDTVKENIGRYIAPMTEDDEELVRTWNLYPLLDDPDYKEGQSRVVNALAGEKLIEAGLEEEEPD